MRLLIATLDPAFACDVRDLLYARDACWNIQIVSDGRDALWRLQHEVFDLLLLHACLPGADGLCVLHTLESWRLCCPPRVLLLCEPEQRPGLWLDAAAPLCAAAPRVCALLETLRQKPVPALALGNGAAYAREAERLLDALGMRRELKGFTYAAHLLARLAPSPALEREPTRALYADCARAFATTPAAVERCLRVAVEGVFTQGSLSGIERHFGATVDPERGKPTNRAFLSQAVQRVRLGYSLAWTRLPNSIDTHHSPAAPTSV